MVATGKRIVKMKLIQDYPQLNSHKMHAKKISKSLSLSLCTSRTIVAHMNDCNDWQMLAQLSGQDTLSSIAKSPISFLDESELTSFQGLVCDYEQAINKAFDAKIHTFDTILFNLTAKKYSAIDHYQIEGILSDYNESSKTSESFMDALMNAESSAAHIVTKALKYQSPFPPDSTCLNLWLKNATLQQSIYAYYHFQGDNLTIKVKEWDTHLRIPNSKDSVMKKPWFAKYMVGYIELLASQFIELGYKPIFEFSKIQSIQLRNLTTKHADKNHPEHGLYLLVENFLSPKSKGAGSNKIIDSNCISVSYCN
jgi:hypothetical protein